jgi:hypothetical protein
VDRMNEPDLTKGKEWSKKDLFSLRNRIEQGRTIAHVAAFLMRTESEVREKVADARGFSVASHSRRSGDPRRKRRSLTRHRSVAGVASLRPCCPSSRSP